MVRTQASGYSAFSSLRRCAQARTNASCTTLLRLVAVPDHGVDLAGDPLERRGVEVVELALVHRPVPVSCACACRGGYAPAATHGCMRAPDEWSGPVSGCGAAAAARRAGPARAARRPAKAPGEIVAPPSGTKPTWATDVPLRTIPIRKEIVADCR